MAGLRKKPASVKPSKARDLESTEITLHYLGNKPYIRLTTGPETDFFAVEGIVAMSPSVDEDECIEIDKTDIFINGMGEDVFVINRSVEETFKILTKLIATDSLEGFIKS